MSDDLRPYQHDTIARVQAAYRDGAQSVLMQLPTGGGKTHCAARGVIAPSVARGRRVAFVADLEEIVDDTAERLRALGLAVGTVKAGRAGDAQAPVQVCSLQTLARRMDALPDAQRVIIDEAHVSSARTAREILSAYKARGALVLGLTATPARGDGQPLDEFERLVCGPSMAELVTMGALVSCEVFAPARVLDKGVCEDPVQAVLTRASERRCCIFAPDAAQAVRIAAELTAAHHRTVAVLDGMGRDERRSVRQRLSAGAVQSLVTVRALQKGFDAPLLDCAVLTTHGTVTTYLQSVGRVLRACDYLPQAAASLAMILSVVEAEHDAPSLALDAARENRQEDAMGYLRDTRGPLAAFCLELAKGIKHRENKAKREAFRLLVARGYGETEARSIARSIHEPKREALVLDLRGAVYLHGGQRG
jgi:superfamily II DNA or RNA helicase